MTGAYNSILGMEISPIVKRFMDQMPTRFSAVEKGETVLNAIVFTIDSSGALSPFKKSEFIIIPDPG